MDMQSPSSSTHSSNYNHKWKYNVFISFRGEDTRYGFTGNLYKALCNKGIHTFFDDGKLQSGEKITDALLKAIENSMTAVVVLSPKYADSSFCLDELVHILDCIKGSNRLVLPVFHEVDPSDVRYLKKSFRGAMAKHEERFKNDLNKVQKWKEALNQVANLSGYHFKTGNHQYEHKFIENIVNRISRKIRRVPLHVADYPVGLESRVSKVIPLLEMDSTDRVYMVGIHGIGGIGKTTLALAIHNSIADHFDGVCFLANVREISNKNGLTHLQNTLLYEILGNEEVKVASVQHGIPIIQQRLSQMKVLLILDDVNDQEQLQAVAGKLDWFGPGSRIVITTRDTQLLKCHGVKKMHEVEKLNDAESSQLLIKKAFKKDEVSQSYADVLNRALTYASGHPLALQIVGSNLFGKEVQLWESALQQCERSSLFEKIQQLLKISYDALVECQKNIFLDITCCFKGYKLKEIGDILGAHYGRDMGYHIDKLVDKSLIKINQISHQVTFHDLIEDMGKEIVHQESPNEPGLRSRLWFHEDIVQVLEENQGTNKVQIIHLEFPLSKMDEAQVVWDGNAFQNMKHLRTLIIKNGCFSEGPKHLPNSLRMMEWWAYPSERLPSDFDPKKLSILRLPNSRVNYFHLDNLSKKLAVLKVLKFDNCELLRETPVVTKLPNLQELSISRCYKLSRIDSSVVNHPKLEIINAERCYSLRTLPPMNLPSLKRLLLSHCSLEEFPEIKENMEKLDTLRLDGTNIKDLPQSFRKLSGLTFLILASNEFKRVPSVISMMPKLSTFSIDRIDGRDRFLPQKEEERVEGSSSSVHSLSVINTKLSDDFLAQQLRWFPNLKRLELTGCDNITVIPECIQELQFLYRLRLDGCRHLREIRGVPPNLKTLSAIHCRSLTASAKSVVLLWEKGHAIGDTLFVLPRARIPSQIERHRGKKTNSISFWFLGKFPAKSLCLAIRHWNSDLLTVTPIMTVNGKIVCRGSGGIRVRDFIVFGLWGTNKNYMSDLDELIFESQEWSHAEVSCEVTAAEIGMHILDIDTRVEMDDDIRFTDPYRDRKQRDEALMGRAGSTGACPSLQQASQNMIGGGNPLEHSGDTSHTKGNALSFCDCGQGRCRCKSTDHCEYLSPTDEDEDFSEDLSNNGESEEDLSNNGESEDFSEGLSDDEIDRRVNFARRNVRTCVRKEWGGMSSGAKNEST